ncbi:MAG: glycine zipper 2TM domain-containing protein [Akkermansiaceae bacterium]
MMKSSLLLTLLAAGALVSCTQHQQNYALGGAAAGALAGAALGDDSSDVIRGAALGAAAGAGTAAYQENQQRNAGAYNTGGEYPPVSPAIPSTPLYKTAIPTEQAGVVRSPYPPFQKVRITGIQSGELAKVPGTNEIFIVP